MPKCIGGMVKRSKYVYRQDHLAFSCELPLIILCWNLQISGGYFVNILVSGKLHDLSDFWTPAFLVNITSTVYNQKYWSLFQIGVPFWFVKHLVLLGRPNGIFSTQRYRDLFPRSRYVIEAARSELIRAFFDLHPTSAETPTDRRSPTDDLCNLLNNWLCVSQILGLGAARFSLCDRCQLPETVDYFFLTVLNIRVSFQV